MQELQEWQVRSLGQKDPLEEGMATHSSILAWKIPWTEEPGGLQSIGSERVRNDSNDLACRHPFLGASQLASVVKNPPAIWVLSLGWEDTLEKEMATHSSILAWEILRTEKSGELESMGSQRVRHDLATEHAHI